MLDLTLLSARQQLAADILAKIDDYCIKTYDDGPRNHLGASELGRPCARELWYKFRWFKNVQHSGRMNRLFNRGHREEERYVEWLRGIGFTIFTHDDNGKQFRVSGLPNAHLGGSLDGVATFPASVDPATGLQLESQPFLLEFKTKGTGSEFTKLKEKGVAFVMPTHFIQTSIYGFSHGLEYALYFCINKNDDDLYVECVKLDFELAQHYLRRGEDIVNSRIPPVRLSDNPAFVDCKICDYASVCHKGVEPDKNCRTCKNSEPLPSGIWQCNFEGHTSKIPNDVLPVGCGQYVAIR